jgi:hypothetical protein
MANLLDMAIDLYYAHDAYYADNEDNQGHQRKTADKLYSQL